MSLFREALDYGQALAETPQVAVLRAGGGDDNAFILLRRVTWNEALPVLAELLPELPAEGARSLTKELWERWFFDCCEQSPECSCDPRRLFRHYLAWHEQNAAPIGVKPLTRARFDKALAAWDVELAPKVDGALCWQGVRLARADAGEVSRRCGTH